MKNSPAHTVKNDFTEVPRAGQVISDYTQAFWECPPELLNYTGNKKVEGLYQQIINLIPPHAWYGSPFAGSDAVFRYKRPSDYSKLNDIDINVYNAWEKFYGKNLSVGFENSCAFDFLKKHQYAQELSFMYCDPPYLESSTASQIQLYDHSLTLQEHKKFLSMVRKVKYNCMISHYPCAVYDTALKGWNWKDIPVCYHGSLQIERLYYNYETPVKLHDYRFLGKDCWERQRIKRKIARHINKLMLLPAVERNAILNSLRTI